MKITAVVQQDHLSRVVQRTSPVGAIAELIWNSLDADASEVDISIQHNGLDGIDYVRVVDNGTGIEPDVAKLAFEAFGDSWKKRKRKSPGGRYHHGDRGEGRYTAFAIGGRVRWTTRFRCNGKVLEYTITGENGDLRSFEVTDPKPAREARTGTEVKISRVDKTPRSLVSEDTSTRLAAIFAVYLRKYPGIRILLDGTLVDPLKVQEYSADYPILGVCSREGDPVSAELTVIEWKHKVEQRELVFCDARGGALAPPQKAGIHAKGFNFTAYLKSDFFREHVADLSLEEMQRSDIRMLVDQAKTQMRGHFRRRAAQEARGLVEKWKEEKVYPFEGSPVGLVEQVERQVFDVVALNLNEYLPDFADADSMAKRFSFQMLRSAIEESPNAVRRIVQEFLELPLERREELIELLDRTSLDSIISASKLVVSRLDFLAGLEVLLYDPVGKQKTKERKQLHRLLAQNTWVFGEEFNLSVDDRSLNEVLRKHLQVLGRSPEEGLAPVTNLDGEEGIVDIMLSRQIRLPLADEFEHLVVELKRPSKKVDADVLAQVEKYAFAVAADERFKTSKVRWTFWAISNSADAYAEKRSHQANMPVGMIHRSENPHVTIWVKTWNQILDECKGRLRFFQDKLGSMVTPETGLDHLQKVYSKYLPDALQGPRQGSGAPAQNEGER
jgi:hypothetical protein